MESPDFLPITSYLHPQYLFSCLFKVMCVVCMRIGFFGVGAVWGVFRFYFYLLKQFLGAETISFSVMPCFKPSDIKQPVSSVSMVCFIKCNSVASSGHPIYWLIRRHSKCKEVGGNSAFIFPATLIITYSNPADRSVKLIVNIKILNLISLCFSFFLSKFPSISRRRYKCTMSTEIWKASSSFSQMSVKD